MELIHQIEGRLGGWIEGFNPSHLRDKTETVFVQIVSFKHKSPLVGIAAGQINPKKTPIFMGYDDGMVLDKEFTTHIVKISRTDQMSPDEEIFFVTVSAESKYDSDMVANHITDLLIKFLQEKGLLKFAA